MAIAAHSLTKRYSEKLALDDVSLEVAAGEIFALLGPNGAGKTTLVEILEGYRKPDDGTARVLGLDPIEQARALKPRMGVMLQEQGHYLGLRVGEYLRLFCSYYREPVEVGRLLQVAGLEPEERKLVRHLSGGQKQRLSLALALAGKPEILFLDEPTAGLDIHARTRTWESITQLREEGVTVFLTTHLLDEAEQVASRVAIIDKGRLLATGSIDEMTASSESVTWKTDRILNVRDVGSEIGFEIKEQGPRHYSLETRGTPELISRLATALYTRGVTMTELNTRSQTLESVFLRLTSGTPD